MFEKIKDFFFKVDESAGEDWYARLLGVAIVVALIVFVIIFKSMGG